MDREKTNSNATCPPTRAAATIRTGGRNLASNQVWKPTAVLKPMAIIKTSPKPAAMVFAKNLSGKMRTLPLMKWTKETPETLSANEIRTIVANSHDLVSKRLPKNNGLHLVFYGLKARATVAIFKVGINFKLPTSGAHCCSGEGSTALHSSGFAYFSHFPPTLHAQTKVCRSKPNPPCGLSFYPAYRCYGFRPHHTGNSKVD